MKLKLSWVVVAVLTTLALAQSAGPHILTQDELKKVIPVSYFFAGQNASVQQRNSVAFKTVGGKLVLAGMVDTSGYSADVASKYQGFLITETKLTVGTSTLDPGAYGFGFTKDGKFGVLNIAGTEVFSVASNSDDKMSHPVPMQLKSDDSGVRLYAGRKYVTLKAE